MGGLKILSDTPGDRAPGGAALDAPAGSAGGLGRGNGTMATACAGQQAQSPQPGGHCSSPPSSGQRSSQGEPWVRCS